MALSIWKLFRTLFRLSEKTDEEFGEEGDESRFIPSPLDLSVRIGHGGSDNHVVRELTKIDEQARALKDSQRRN